jgi:hypothetical protein
MRSFRFAVFLVTYFVISSSSGWTQSATASILGRVLDPQGAAIPATKITVTNVSTQVTVTTETDSQGDYRVLALPIGTYIVTAEHQGFSKLVTEPRTLQINQQERMDLYLVVGTRSETVEVRGVGSNVETVNPTLGQSVTARPIVNLPLNGRNVLALALLQPGVTETNPDDGSAGNGSGAGFSVGGGRSDSTTYLLDGGLNNDLLGNGVVLNPNPDAIEEFKILTSNYTAEYGRNGAGIISVVTKSGTNHLHGSAFDFVRNTDFDSNTYFNIQAGLPRNDLKRHQFGGTIGGPITIPHVIEGKDRLFFFIAYQGQRQTQTETQSSITTFTPAELRGDFSQAVNGGPDANVAAFLKANPYFATPNGNAAKAIIDPSKIDPAAKAYIGLGLIPTSPSGVISSAAPAKDNNNELTGKVDVIITSKDKISFTIGGFRNPTLDPFGTNGADVTGFPSTDQRNRYFSNIAYTRTFSPNLLNEFRVTAQRLNSGFGQPAVKLPNSSQLGFGIASDLPNGPPLMTFDNPLVLGISPQGPAFEIGTTYAFTDALSWVKGRNTWKFGGGFSIYQNNTIYDFYGDGNFAFLGPYSQGGIGTGNSFADFLVGIPNNFFEGPNARNNIRSKATYGFLQDEWRATKKLTLTLGIRYEYSTPKLDTAGRNFEVIPGHQSTRFPNAPLGLAFPGDPGTPRGVNFPDKDNFAPRFGFAWDPWGNAKTSIRGGAGIFYDVLKGEDNLQFNGAPPFYSEPFASYPCPAANVDPTTFLCTVGTPTYPVGRLPFYSQPWTSAGFPGNPFPSQPPTASSAFNVNTGNSLPFGGGGIYFVDPHLHTPYTYQYNLSVERQLKNNLTAEVNYVGSSSKGLTSLIDVNPFILSTLSTNPTRVLNVNQNAALTNFCTTFFGSGAPSACPLSIALEFANVTFANFNSLEASLTKQVSDNRYVGTTYFTLAYTYGHSIDNTSGFRNRSSQVPAYYPGLFRGSSDFDLRNRITFSGGWDLPFDRAWESGPKRFTKGFSLYPILTWRTGFPLSINAGESSNAGDPGSSGAGDGYIANAVFAPGFNSVTITNPRKNGNQYFNPAAFLCPVSGGGTAPCTPTINDNHGYGLPRNFFRGPGRTNLDLALAKTTGITEQVNAEFRVEAFNLFNHGEFSNPDVNINSATFGQVTTTDFGTGLTPLHTERILQLALRLTF